MNLEKSFLCCFKGTFLNGENWFWTLFLSLSLLACRRPMTRLWRHPKITAILATTLTLFGIELNEFLVLLCFSWHLTKRCQMISPGICKRKPQLPRERVWWKIKKCPGIKNFQRPGRSGLLIKYWLSQGSRRRCFRMVEASERSAITLNSSFSSGLIQHKSLQIWRLHQKLNIVSHSALGSSRSS